MASLIKSLNLSHEHTELENVSFEFLRSFHFKLHFHEFIRFTDKLFVDYSNSHVDDELIFAPLRLGVVVVVPLCLLLNLIK